MKTIRKIYSFMAEFERKGGNVFTKIGNFFVFEDCEPLFLPSLMFFIVLPQALEEGAKFHGELIYKSKF